MESLLKWSIENSSTTGDGSQPVQPRKDLNPEIIDAILGKSDAEQMKDDMAIAVDANRSEDDRVDALDHLEMLIEQIDNANNLGKLKIWEPLHALVTSESSTDPVILQALWVIGTALQNNPAAQDSYLSLNPLPTLTSFLSSSANVSPQIRSKVIYALSGLLKHNTAAVSKLDDDDTDGWTKFKQGLQDPDISVRRKVAFLLSTLLTPAELKSTSNGSDRLHTPNTQDQRNPQPVHPNSHAIHLTNPNRVATSPLTLKAVEKHGIVGAVIDGLTNPVPYGEDGDIEEPDTDFEEKSIGLLRTYAVNCNGQLSRRQKDTIKGWLEKEQQKEGESGESKLAERWGLSSRELQELVKRVE